MLKSMVRVIAVTAMAISPAFHAVAQEIGNPGPNASPEEIQAYAKRQIDYAVKRVKDPNMPYAYGQYGGWGTGTALLAVDGDPRKRVRLDWTYHNTTAPQVRLFWPTGQDEYLGFNARGTWILDLGHEGDKILLLVFNGPNNTMETVARGATTDEVAASVPKDLRTPSCRFSEDCYTEDLFGPGVTYPRREEAARNEALKHKPKPAPNPNAALGTALVNSLPVGVAGGAQGGAAQGSGAQGSGSPAAMKPIHGVNATVTNGVLSFIVDDPQSPDNGQRESFPVVRSGMGAPTATGASAASGLWVAKESSRVIMFAVQTDSRVTGTPLAPGAGAMFSVQPPQH